MIPRSAVIPLALLFLAAFFPAAASADQACPSKLFSREVVEGGFQGVVCDKYCRIHLSLPGGLSRDFIAAGAVQDFETAGGEMVRVTVEELQLQDDAVCLREHVATAVRLVSAGDAKAVVKKKASARKKKRSRPRRR
jgi:hypothetical protein